MLQKILAEQALTALSGSEGRLQLAHVVPADVMVFVDGIEQGSPPSSRLQVENVRVLVEAGADAGARASYLDAQGQPSSATYTALDHAANDEIRKLLREAISRHAEQDRKTAK